MLQENVASFPTSLLETILGALYHVEECLLNPSQFGFLVQRPRKCELLRHRLKTGVFASPLNIFFHMFFFKIRVPVAQQMGTACQHGTFI